MHRIPAWTIAVCAIAILAPLISFAGIIPLAERACVSTVRVQVGTDPTSGAPQYETLNRARAEALAGQCEDGKIYTIAQEPQPEACKSQGVTVQAFKINWRWQDGVNAKTNPKPKGRIEFTMISAKGDLGTKVSTECKPGQKVTDAAASDPQFTPYSKGATKEGIDKALALGAKDKNGVQQALSDNKAFTDQLKKNFDATPNPTEEQKTELARALEDQKILNDIAAEKGAIGQGEAAAQNRALDADLAKRLDGYKDPNTWGHYYSQTPTTIEKQGIVPAWKDKERQQEAAGFVDPKTAADQQAKIMEYQNAREDYEQCVAETSWYARKLWCLRKEYTAANAISYLEAQGCKVDVSVWGNMGEASCPGSEVTTSTTETPPNTSSVHSENSSITTGNSSPSGFCIISSRPPMTVPANDPRCQGETIYAPGTTPPPRTTPPPGSNDCTALDTRCQAEIDGPLKGNGPYCAELARCQNGNGAPPPGGYQDPRGYGGGGGSYGGGGGGNPGGSNPPNQSNPNGYNGLSQQDQQMLERQCFDYGNSSACSALKRYCEQSQNQNQNSSLGGIGQYLPIITSLISGNTSGLGNLGGGGGMSQQQCANLNNQINNGMCRQYQGTIFTNGRCECPAGGQWDGTKCPATGANSCAQYPGTVLTNGTCQCPSGQQWNGTSCGGTTAQELQAELACAPSIADIDETPVAVSWQCRGADTSKGDGFNTNGSTSGSATVKLKSADLNADATNVDLTLTCTKTSNTKTAVCPLEINRPFIVAVATYSKVKRGETATIGWISKGMKEGNDPCRITSNKHGDFSQTGRNVVLTTPPIQEQTIFTIKCTTKGGITKTAPVTIELE